MIPKSLNVYVSLSMVTSSGFFKVYVGVISAVNGFSTPFISILKGSSVIVFSSILPSAFLYDTFMS